MPKKTLFPDTKAVASPTNRKLRLAFYNDLSSWTNFNRLVGQLDPSSTLIKRYIIIENETRNRPHILKRLVGLLHTTERKELYKKLALS